MIGFRRAFNWLTRYFPLGKAQLAILNELYISDSLPSVCEASSNHMQRYTNAYIHIDCTLYGIKL
jgi:hypothetical protein